MCILCVIQKWSRRIATVLPLLVLPLIGLWALSQMLPPAFRFEITSPRLACVFVLLVTLFWYEILMPKLSAWRAHRNARLRERKRNQAIELQKLRKTATRKCRNCLTPYRDQNPCGGKFMCSYCGHISKRPVLDLPVPPGMAMSNSGIIKELVGKGGKLLNGRPWSENGWMCSQEWRDNGNWGGGGGTFAPKPVNWRKNANGFFGGGDEYCSTEKSYSGLVIFTCKLLTSFLLSIRWLWRKIFSGRSSSEAAAFGTDSGLLSKRGESIGNFNESRSERARRKAEEKRQARIEKELLEEEERKQREEVARLVEERRKLRDVKSAAEKDTEKAISPVKDKGSKREAEKKRQERRKERDRGSSKSSNSDAEELEKKVGKEGEKKRDSDRRSESDGREHRKFATDIVKGHSYDIGRGQKNVSPYNVNRGSAGARYLDRMRNNLLSSSKAFSGSNFFGRTANSPAVIQKESKPNSSVNHVYSSAQKKEVGPPERVAGQSVVNGIPSEPQPQPAPKKSWQQLFTRATPVHPSSSANVISRPNAMVPTDVKSPPLPSQTGPAPFNEKQINFGFQSPFPVYTSQNATASSSSLGFSPAIDPIFPHVGGRQHEHIPEESDLFEDPCYVPDPALLLGPVSESLDNFQLDLGSGFISDIGLQKPRSSKIAGPASEISRPSPIESPMSRLRGIDDRHSSASGLPGTPKLQDKRNSPFEDEKSWQLWGPSPLGQDGLGLIGGSPWHLAPEPNRLSKEEFMRPSPQRTMVSLFSEDHGLPSTCSPQKDLLHGGQSSGLFSPLAVSNDKDPWVQQAFIPPLSDTEKHFPFKHQEEPTENDAFFGSPTGSAPNHPFMLSPADRWSKKEWAGAAAGAESGEDSSRNQAVVSPPQNQNGDVYPPPPPPPLMYSHFGGK